jgi:hypothetical protein
MWLADDSQSTHTIIGSRSSDAGTTPRYRSVEATPTLQLHTAILPRECSAGEVIPVTREDTHEIVYVKTTCYHDAQQKLFYYTVPVDTQFPVAFSCYRPELPAKEEVSANKPSSDVDTNAWGAPSHVPITDGEANRVAFGPFSVNVMGPKEVSMNSYIGKS